MLWFFLDWGHIRCCGGCRWRFRSYSESLFPNAGFEVWGLGFGGHIRFFGCCLWRFRSYSESPFPNAEKVTQKALPRRTALRLGSVFPRYGVHPGASPPVCFAAPPLDGCGFAAWRCAPNPRMNTYARPAEGAEDQKPNQELEPKQSQSRSKDHSLRQFLLGLGAFSKRLVGCQAAFASKPAPTVGMGAFSWSLVGCQAAIASRLAPTIQRACNPAAKPPHSTQ